jgi:hypothetical protein
MAAIFQIGKVPASRWCALIDAYIAVYAYGIKQRIKDFKDKSDEKN